MEAKERENSEGKVVNCTSSERIRVEERRGPSDLVLRLLLPSEPAQQENR